MQSDTPIRLLTPAEAGRKIGRSELTLGRWRRERRGPAYIRLGARVAYDERAIDAWLMSQQVEPGPESIRAYTRDSSGG